MFPQRIHDARSALARAIADHASAADECQRLLRKLPENTANVPAEVCAQMLRGVGFAVLHRDHLERVIGVVAAAEGDDKDEEELLEKLLATEHPGARPDSPDHCLQY